MNAMFKKNIKKRVFVKYNRIQFSESIPLNRGCVIKMSQCLIAIVVWCHQIYCFMSKSNPLNCLNLKNSMTTQCLQEDVTALQFCSFEQITIHLLYFYHIRHTDKRLKAHFVFCNAWNLFILRLLKNDSLSRAFIEPITNCKTIQSFSAMLETAEQTVGRTCVILT